VSEVLADADGPVGRITLNRPEKLNAVTVTMGTQLRDALTSLAESCDVLVIRGAGGNFCAGGDFDEVSRLQHSRAALDELFENWVSACSLIAQLPVPVVAAVEGVAMAGGFELLSSVDVGLVRTDAKLADNHSNFGMVPGGGGSQRLPRIVGRQRALGHILTGERLTGEQAAAWGLVYKAFEPETFEAGVETLVQRLAGHDRTALARAKRMIVEGSALSLTEGLALEREIALDHLVREGQT
jgi:enoyl-CoA hydratase/carnithine racemase